jgi:hypothetical protein
VLPALSDVKLAYTEVSNPFLTKELLFFARSLPDHLRSNRKLFIQIATEISPDVKYASKKATGKQSNVFSSAEAIKLMTDELDADYIKEIFPDTFLRKVKNGLQNATVKKNNGLTDRIKTFIKNVMPLRMKEILGENMKKPTLNNSTLAFRVYMTGKVYKMFTEDVKATNE